MDALSPSDATEARRPVPPLSEFSKYPVTTGMGVAAGAHSTTTSW